MKSDSLWSSAVVVKPTSGWMPINLGDLWKYRELLYFLTWRDVKVRYKQTVLGIAWAVIQPVLIMVVFSIFFGRLAKVPSNGFPYPIFAFCALLPWQLFGRALTDASTSLVVNECLITKVYFPRLLVPAAAVLTSLVDFCIALVVLMGMMFFYNIPPTIAIVTLPFFILLAGRSGGAVGPGGSDSCQLAHLCEHPKELSLNTERKTSKIFPVNPDPKK